MSDRLALLSTEIILFKIHFHIQRCQLCGAFAFRSLRSTLLAPMDCSYRKLMSQTRCGPFRTLIIENAHRFQF